MCGPCKKINEKSHPKPKQNHQKSQIKVNREMQTVPIGRKVMMTGERHLTKIVDERILLTFYNAMFEEMTHCTS